MRVSEKLEKRLNQSLNPILLELINESQNHHVPDGSETHFNAIIVAKAFEGLSLIQRHRKVYQAIGESLKGELHAFTMKTLTPDEWNVAARKVENESPKCRGGSQ